VQSGPSRKVVLSFIRYQPMLSLANANPANNCARECP
jgi:hypothetical protein